jgi:hypothetical protein
MLPTWVSFSLPVTRQHAQQPLVVDRVIEAANVGIEHPVHMPAHDRRVERRLPSPPVGELDEDVLDRMLEQSLERFALEILRDPNPELRALGARDWRLIEAEVRRFWRQAQECTADLAAAHFAKVEGRLQ